MASPILDILAAEAARKDLPISGVSVVAPAQAGPALMVVGWAAMEKEEIDLGNGVSMATLSRVNEHVVALPQITDIGSACVAAAWGFGAWDVCITHIGAGYAGVLRPEMQSIERLVREQGHITWYFRPMLRGPEIRIKAHAHKDATLNKWSNGRDAAAPVIRVGMPSPGNSHTIRLGGARPSAIPPATDRQRHYLTALKRRAGEDDCLPPDLDRQAASAEIDRLSPMAPARRRKKLLMTVNQWRLLDHLLKIAKRPPLALSALRTMSYDEAQSMISSVRDGMRAGK